MSDTRRRQRTLITGGASGLGAAIVDRCVGRGDHVVVIDRKESATHTIVADVSDVSMTVAAVREAIAHLGGLDNLVTSAGMNRPGFTRELDPELVARMIDVNLTGTVCTTIAALDALVESGGRAVFIASTMTRRGNLGQAAYAATKHGVAGFVHSLGYEFRGQLGLTLIEPGAMDTALFEGRDARWMPPDHVKMSPAVVADAVIFALEQPGDVSIRELLITHNDAPDWP
jgi:NAD(P)-dependent dehydrogenase (short-subunit alcohol dehydrogenase family)